VEFRINTAVPGTMSNDLEVLAATLPETQYNLEATDHHDKAQQMFVERGASPLGRGWKMGAFTVYNLRWSCDIQVSRGSL